MDEAQVDGGAFTLEDDAVIELGRFLRSAPLSNGTAANIPGGMSELLAQAVLNWHANRVYDGQEWVTRAEIEASPEFGEVEVSKLGDDEAVKLRHRETGIVALDVDSAGAWRILTEKVRRARLAAREGGNDGD